MRYERIKEEAKEIFEELKGLARLTLKEFQNNPDNFATVYPGLQDFEKIINPEKGLLPIPVSQLEYTPFGGLPHIVRAELTRYAARDPRINAVYISNPEESKGVFWFYPGNLKS